MELSKIGYCVNGGIVLQAISKTPKLKKWIKNNPLITDGYINLYKVVDQYGLKTSLNNATNEKCRLLFTSVINSSTDILDLKDELLRQVSDPDLLRDYDGFLTIMFNKHNSSMSPCSVKIGSFINDVSDLVNIINDDRSSFTDVHKEAITTSLHAMFLELKTTARDYEVYSERLLEHAEDNGEMLAVYGTIWAPIVIKECHVVLTSDKAISSFNNIKDTSETAYWKTLLHELYNDEKEGTLFRDSRRCRLSIFDPFMTVKEYEVYMSLNKTIKLLPYNM